MKCPKCGYISFDYNDACPKCNKDITAEREKMNLPAYSPNPPSLLTSLTGERDESDFDLKIESTDGVDSMEQEVSLSPEDSQAIEAMEEAFKDSQELEIELDAGHDDERVESPERAEVQEETPPQDLSELSIEDSETGLPQEVKAGGEEIALGEALSLEDSETGSPQAEQAAVDEMDLELDLSVEDSETSIPQMEQAAMDDVASDLDPSALEIPETEKTAIFDPLKIDGESDSFNLDDLSGVEPGQSIEADISVEEKDEALLDLEGLDSILDESVEEVVPSAKTDGEKDENFSLDLESLELDLDLETPEDKSS